MKRAVAAFAVAGALLLLQASGAPATDGSSCSSTAASGTRTTCPSSSAADDAAYAALSSRLGADVAKGLAAQRRLSATLAQFAGIEQSLTAEVAAEEAIIETLQAKIAQLDTEIADTESRIDIEKQELSALARAIYREPQSLWLLMARTGNLHDALMATADAVVAGQRAHALQQRLEADLAKLQADRDARQADLDTANGNRELLAANLSSLQEVMGVENGVSSDLTALIAQIQNAASHVRDQSPDAAAELAALLEAQEQDLILRSYQTAWSEAQVGIGQAMVNNQLPVGRTIAGLALSWPLASFRITQPFGPSTVLLEPPYGPYPHFHTGIDIAAPLGAAVMAAADGVVVAVGHSSIGYGNYVIVAHGGGIATLYGHLLRTNATVGQQVGRGQVIGFEGQTGLATGPHVHFELRINNQVIDPMPYLPLPGTSWSA